jgi:hypothetical protein
MTLGKGAAISSSNKMKCNTQSSTETELISLHDKLPDIVWTHDYFVECQGYDIDECVVFQDNMSAGEKWLDLVIKADKAYQSKVLLSQRLL